MTKGPEMIAISQEIQEALTSNWHRSRQDKSFDPTPVLKLFLPWAPVTWLVSEMNPRDRDSLFGLAIFSDEAELGDFSLAEIAALEGPADLRVEIDQHWRAQKTLNQYLAEHSA